MSPVGLGGQGGNNDSLQKVSDPVAGPQPVPVGMTSDDFVKISQAKHRLVLLAGVMKATQKQILAAQAIVNYYDPAVAAKVNVRGYPPNP